MVNVNWSSWFATDTAAVSIRKKDLHSECRWNCYATCLQLFLPAIDSTSKDSKVLPDRRRTCRIAGMTANLQSHNASYGNTDSEAHACRRGFHSAIELDVCRRALVQGLVVIGVVVHVFVSEIKTDLGFNKCDESLFVGVRWVLAYYDDSLFASVGVVENIPQHLAQRFFYAVGAIFNSV